MYCIIIEDEPPAIAVLKKYAEKVEDLQIQGIFQHPMEALSFLRNHSTDLLFLDINLPDLSGIELLKSLPNPPKVIFTTAYPEFALDGFELRVSDFLLKPFSFERFLKAVNKVFEEIETEKKLQEWTEAKEKEALIIKADRKIFRLVYEEICYLQAYGDYVKIITETKQFLPKQTLHHIEEQLPEEQFVRIHRSYIISLTKVEYIEGNHVHIKGQNLPIGKSYREAFLKRMK